MLIKIYQAFIIDLYLWRYHYWKCRNQNLIAIYFCLLIVHLEEESVKNLSLKKY